jgi:formate dehydrogenase subunit gamma
MTLSDLDRGELMEIKDARREERDSNRRTCRIRPYWPASTDNMEEDALNRIRGTLRKIFLVLLLAILSCSVPVSFVADWSFMRNTVVAQTKGDVPGNVFGNESDAEVWRYIRKGGSGDVSITDRKAAILVQSEGELWRSIRNGPLSLYGAWGVLGIVALLAVFFAIRGRIRIESGYSANWVRRFNGVERFAHWLTAMSFLILALTGLNMLYGRYVLKPLIGYAQFATVTAYGKYAHDFVSFAFMVGIALILIIWARDNLPNKHDWIWLAKGGGLFARGVHPPARKFNAGQKLFFWLVVITGVSLSVTGVCLLTPFAFAPFDATFTALNLIGLELPTGLAPMQEMQLAHVWHAILALVMIVVIIGHIYIGSIGMEGAYSAMGSGVVDENWAREHHPLWAAELGLETEREDNA